MWWKRHLDLTAAAFFRGTLTPPLASLHGLEQAGVAVTAVIPQRDQQWAVRLRHPEWGEATLSAPRERFALPEHLVQHGSGLSPAERELLGTQAECSLWLQVPGERGDVFRDRKRLLRFLRAVLGNDGLGGLDLMAQLVWTRAGLDDELQHDAPLDIIQVHVLHVVSADAGVWLHSHGLSEMGFVDFDVLRPAEAILHEQFDVLRAIAFAILEGAVSGEIQPVAGAEPIALVDAAHFMRAAGSADRALREADGHTDRRVVCCDGRPAGLLGRLFGAAEARPSRLLARGMEEGRHLVIFSSEATALGAERARQSLALFERFRQEFQDLQCTGLVKLGYATDSATDGEREHLWFEVHDLLADGLDATLVNEPFDISRLHAGQRAVHPTETVTDWSIVTPLGQLTPRSLEMARQLRELRPRILEALQSQPPAGT